MVLPSRSNRREDSKKAKKANSRGNLPKVEFKIRGGSLLDQINAIVAGIVKEFKGQEHKYKSIHTLEELNEYIDAANKAGEFVLDTETTSLCPITCTIAGTCIYVKGKLPAYVPHNHVSYVTGVRVDNQISVEDMKKALDNLSDNVKIIYHNAKFDIRVIKHQLGKDLSLQLWWDTMIVAPLLNENEPKGLKYLHETYCSKVNANKNYSELFNNIPFIYVPVAYAHFYAAKDALMTYELYKFQFKYLDPDSQTCKERGLVKLAEYYQDIELPTVLALIEMEDNGIKIDTKYSEDLLQRMNLELKEVETKFLDYLNKFYSQSLKTYRLQQGIKCKLKEPVSLSSPDQLSILLYDIIGLAPLDKRSPRGTGHDILVKITESSNDTTLVDLVQSILDHRTLNKLITTYVKKLPKEVKQTTGKVHTNFNQHIADTGRLSSSDPNLQNIPKKGKYGEMVRRMFVADSSNCFVFADYSQQEPRVLAELSQDQNLINSYLENKDLYGTMGSFVYDLPYEDCLERDSNGNASIEGKKRRNSMKPVILGVMYDRTDHTIAESLGISTKQAANMMDKFFDAFPGVLRFRGDSINFAKEFGYVEMICGRKRRLPDMLLPNYQFERIGEGSDFDPLAGLDSFDLDDVSFCTEVDDDTIQMYTKALNKAWGYKQKQAIVSKAKEEGVKITDNTLKISDTTRKVVNAQIQGSSSIITKNAMVKFMAHKIIQLKHRRPQFYEDLQHFVEKSLQLNELNCKLILQVHDELAVECKEDKNISIVCSTVKEIMINSAAQLISVPMAVDCEVSKRWNGEVIDV